MAGLAAPREQVVAVGWAVADGEPPLGARSFVADPFGNRVELLGPVE